MKINLNMNLEAQDNILEAIKTVEKGVMAQNVWKPSGTVLEDNNEINGNELSDNSSVEDFEQNTSFEKVFSEKMTENNNSISNDLFEKTIWQIFRLNSQNICKNQFNSEEVLKFYTNKIFENSNKSLYSTQNYLKNNLLNSAKNILNSENSSENFKNQNLILNESVLKNKEFKNFEGENSSEINFSMEKYNRINENIFSESKNETSEIQNLNENYKYFVEDKNSKTNNFYNNFVINCSSEEIKNEDFTKVLTKCVEKTFSSLIEKSERGYFYG